MAPSVLFLVSDDPRTSPRPAEAVRIAAGVGTWKNVEITVCLCGLAVRALAENADDLVDGEHFTRYWPMVCESGRPLYVETGAPLLEELGRPLARFERISAAQLAGLAARSDYVVRF